MQTFLKETKGINVDKEEKTSDSNTDKPNFEWNCKTGDDGCPQFDPLLVHARPAACQKPPWHSVPLSPPRPSIITAGPGIVLPILAIE